MIGWEDVYKVVVAMAPLYFALVLGYGAVKWWRIFNPEQCEAVNRLVCYFFLPMFALEFTANVNPFNMNYLLLGADAISKVLIVIVLACWAKFSTKAESYGWSITSFSLSTLTSSLVVGVPLLRAMYGEMAVDLVVQLSVFQALVWLTILLFVFEVRRTRNEYYSDDDDRDRVAEARAAGDLEAQPQSNNGDVKVRDPVEQQVMVSEKHPAFWALTKMVWLKIMMNPNSYACIVGIAWACLSKRWHWELPSIVQGSIQLLSRASTGTAMFSMGLFMASQKKIIACGPSLTVFGMVLRFVAGPLAMAIASLAVGLRGDVLRVAIIQAALPQSITSFIYAKEYGLHADILSTAVIFGMMVSLPVLIGYYAALESLP